MQVEVDVKCMQTNFGVRGISSFGDFAPFQIWPNFPFGPWNGGQKIELAQKIHASRG